MNSNEKWNSAIVYLDHSFGMLRRSEGDQGERIFGIDLMPGVRAALEFFKNRQVRLVVQLSETLREDSLQVLGQYLPWVDRFIPADQAAIKAREGSKGRPAYPADKCLVVAADRRLRGEAIRSGYATYPHAAIAALALKTRDLHFARLIGEGEIFERLPDLIPYYTEALPDGGWYVLAVLSGQALAEAAWRGLKLDRLPLDLAAEDPMFIHFDGQRERIKEQPRGFKLLSAEEGRMLAAVDSEVFDSALSFHGRHGHYQFLFPNPGLMAPAPAPETQYRDAQLALSRLPLEKVKIARIPDVFDIGDIILRICPVTQTSFQADVDRYSGVTSLDSAGAIQSRHIQHPDNARVVTALVDDLQDMGYCAYTHQFNYAGLTLKNVIADLPGIGYWRLDPDILARARDILIKYPLPDPPDPWIKPFLRVLGKDWLEEQQLADSSPLELRMAVEQFIGLKHWRPWWLRNCLLTLAGPRLVIVGCHLDSTAASDSGYDPLTDPAPGADDDASGIAGTLAIARYLAGFRGKLINTVRFCFFNAEESGLVGSKAYAAMLKAANAPIKAVVCMDMMGYNSDAARIFEIHAGYYDAAVRDISVPIAETIASWSASLGQLSPAQIYKGTSASGGPDRNASDGAINRSDHAAFHQQGYPAVVVSEDFFMNLSTEPGADPNPNYHRGSDSVIDSDYAADITCAVAYAVKELAQSF